MSQSKPIPFICLASKAEYKIVTSPARSPHKEVFECNAPLACGKQSVTDFETSEVVDGKIRYLKKLPHASPRHPHRSTTNYVWGYHTSCLNFSVN